jgi:hypothetical protein
MFQPDNCRVYVTCPGQLATVDGCSSHHFTWLRSETCLAQRVAILPALAQASVPIPLAQAPDRFVKILQSSISFP